MIRQSPLRRAGTPDGSDGAANARTLAAPGTITCPDVAPKLPAVPASAIAIDRIAIAIGRTSTEPTGRGGRGRAKARTT
ncbi:hypothetical protein ABZ478_09995 [Streptomyces sp. NPDC005706]|uniref:hypothetical protein n=1 Tax=Streptomyces sp. NPDC005706 TaxID=3157169 RepID=UPI0033DA2398